VQLSIASEVPVVQVTPSWNLESFKKTGGSIVLIEYQPYFQNHILSILAQRGVKAIPALFSSAFQLHHTPKRITEINQLLECEPKEQKKYFTLIPVVRNSSALFTYNHYTINISLSIFVQEKNGLLGKELFTTEFECVGTTKTLPVEDEDFKKMINIIREKLATLPQWNLIIDYINNNAQHMEQLPSFSKIKLFKGQYTHKIGLSKGFFYTTEPSSKTQTPFRYITSSFYISKVNEYNDQLTFQFDLANEIPTVQYVYTIAPNYSIKQISDENINVEKTPDALPSETYNSNRYLIINLPGISNESIVAFSFAFRDPAYFDSAYFSNAKSAGRYSTPLAEELEIGTSNDSTSWDIRVWMPFLTNTQNMLTQTRKATIAESLYVEFCQNDQYSGNITSLAHKSTNRSPAYSLFNNKSAQNLTFSSRNYNLTNRYEYKMYIFSGVSKNALNPVSEPLKYSETPVLRVSTISTVDSLYSELRDSIYCILNKKHNSNITEICAADSNSLDTCVSKILNYMSDNLRYIHVSFNTHRAIPRDPDTILESRMGDCKDFSIVLIQALKDIGIEAVPALVNTSDNSIVPLTLPSSYEFNHMIVYVPKFKWWIDPLNNPISPRIIPQHLTGLRSLIFFKDSLRFSTIPANHDSVNFSSLTYNFEINDKTLQCTCVENPSYEKSANLKKNLPSIDSSTLLSSLYSNDMYSQMYTPKETILSVNTDSQHCSKCIIKRTISFDNCLLLTGTQKFMHLPERPLDGYVSLFLTEQRYSDMYFPLDLNYEVVIKIASPYRATWQAHAMETLKSPFLFFTIISRNEIRFHFKVNKGLITVNEYNTLKKSFDAYRDFFSTPVLISKVAKK
jgi:transglutaminase-like putative cysteine protease